MSELLAQLTPEQEAIAHAGRDERIVVEAGAGTGKTFTLVERLRWLIEEQGCRPPGILVLSFSRAVVHAIRLRTREAGLASLDVRTFDSFALELAPPSPEGARTSPDFDQQVRCASTAVLNDPIAQDVIHDVEHVLIDEAQDLVGPRADLVRALLTQLRCGFTVFGDRAQAIYGFAVDNAAPAQDDDLLSWASNLPKVRAVGLSQAFRAKGKWPLEVIKLQNAVRLHPEAAYHDLVSLTYRLPVVPSLAALKPFVDRTTGRVAFLCRTNGDALVLSSELDDAGIAHAFRRSAHERFAPKWLARAVAGVESPLIDAAELGKRITDVLPTGTIGVERSLDLLRRIGRSGSRKIDLRRVADRVRNGNLPPLLATEHDRVVVSTIHRSKGLEFEHVILCTGDWADNGMETDAEAARVLFVALTRAEKEIFQLKVNLPQTNKAKGRLGNRWSITSFRGRMRYPAALEFRPMDIDFSWPDSLNADQFLAQQRYLSDGVKPGDRVSLTHVGWRADIPLFEMEHQGTCIGRTSDDWGAAILAAVASDPRRMPKRADGLRIDRVLTTASSPLPQHIRANASGLYLQVWLRGLAMIDVSNPQ